MESCALRNKLLPFILLACSIFISTDILAQAMPEYLNQEYAMTAFIYPKSNLEVAQFDPNGRMLAPLKGIQVFVFPNPAVDQVTVQLSEPIKDQIDVLISDEKGNIILNSCIAQGAVFICLPVDALPRGEYYVHIKLKDKQYTEKLLLKN